MKKRLLLVVPGNHAVNYVDLPHVAHLTRKKAVFFNGSLGVLAALTPPEFEIEIVHENVSPIDFRRHYDIVGITGFPTQIARAREIAERFKKSGALVVCGGASVTVSAERWRPFSDVLFIGEAERTWPRFLQDYLAGRHQDEYRDTERFDLSIVPPVDYRGMPAKDRKAFFGAIVQHSRGCPYDCEFCDVIVYIGRKVRFKPDDVVMQDIESYYRMGVKTIFFADDNLGINRKKTMSLLRKVRAWNQSKRRPVTFAGSVSIERASDEEFIELAVEAGLTRVSIGIESPNPESLEEAGKRQNLRGDLIEGIRTFQRHGILVQAGCMVGFDHDDLSIFQRQYDFFTEAGVGAVNVFPLQAPDGTALKARLIREGRYIDMETAASRPGFDGRMPKARTVLNTFTVVPKQFSVAQLQQGTLWLLWQFYRMPSFVERFISFFDTFERSPKKDRLNIPKTLPDREGLGILARVVGDAVVRGTAEERSALRELFAAAKASSHPQRFPIAVTGYLTAKNMIATLREDYPDIAGISYPLPSAGSVHWQVLEGSAGTAAGVAGAAG